MIREAIAFTLQEEGGYSTDPDDPGNWSSGKAGVGVQLGSMMGISAPTLLAWIGSAKSAMISADYMRALQPALAHAIYTEAYWIAANCGACPTGLDLMVFDHAVNRGARNGVRSLQHALGFNSPDDDGLFGPITAAAMAKVGNGIIPRLKVVQEVEYRRSDDFPTYGTAWLARLGRRAAAALRLAAQQPGSATMK